MKMRVRKKVVMAGQIKHSRRFSLWRRRRARELLRAIFLEARIKARAVEQKHDE